MNKFALSVLTLALISGCSMNPEYSQPAAPVDNAWPAADSYPSGTSTQAAELGDWRGFFKDPALVKLIDNALNNNRDLRVAALNVESYQAQYRIQRSQLYPQLDANGSGTRQRLPDGINQSGESSISSQYSATLGVSAWELDFFGRLRSLNQAALEQYFATIEAQQGVRISLIASVANAWFTLEADRLQLDLTEQTLTAYQRSYDLTKRSVDAGAASAIDLSQAKTALDGAKVARAQYRRLVAQDQNALAVLLGGPIPQDLPASLPLTDTLLTEVPAGLPSQLLQRRPDILQTEHQLKAANANIGAARAAFFPSISLTANAGSMSSSLSDLLQSGTGTWLFQPEINLPIFTAGRLQASLDVAEIEKNSQIAQYEKAIQQAFQEVSDGLTARQTYREQLDAQQQLLSTTEQYYTLAERRYRGGVDSYLVLLDAQRQLFQVRQDLINDRLAQLSSEVNLYKALGGGWQPGSEQADGSRPGD
ncbi:multidrug transporter [Pseudomonas sp. J237]|jgi:multidrug efflux system outer membrane protein|nr:MULTISPECIES: AdeC/AdeK/OprM family multidrug efflux complex outer membrane factor [Pseudomonas]OEO27269.1 multidrug transporter [Pseudomonas sp. J237]